MDKKIVFVLIFIIGIAAGFGGFYLFQNKTGLSPEKAGQAAIEFINKALAKESANITASLVSVTEESGLYKIHLKIENNEYDSFISKDGKYLFSTAFNLEEENTKEAADQEINLEILAQCLTDKGAKFYGASWCGHCQSQKKMFGEFAGLLPYVECSTSDGGGQLDICKDNNISGYPTWVFADGSRESGELSPQKLSEKTGCPLSQ